MKDTLNYLRRKEYDDLAFLLENTWRKHPPKRSDNHYQMWKEQVAVNLPVLYLASIYLHIFVKERKIKNLLFATRDCSHWYKIYSAMYPDEKCHYFHCSRNMFNLARTTSRPSYERYVDRVTDNDISHSVFIDIHGTGRRMYEYFSERGDSNGVGKVPRCFILSSAHSDTENLCDGIVHMIERKKAEFVVFKAGGGPIEMLNYDLIGTCNDYNRNGAVRAELEYDEDKIKPYHDCVDRFVTLIKRNPSLVDKQHSCRQLRKAIRHLFEPCLVDLPVVSEWIDHERKHTADP